MTPQEFKAWFDGFTEAFGEKLPTQKQWKRIKERVSEIDGNAITERVFIDRYWWPRNYTYTPSPYNYPPVYLSNASETISNYNFNSTSSMYHLGQLEAQS